MIIRFLARHFRSPRHALATDHPPHIPVTECLHALESRYLFDAAGVATGAEAAVDAVAQEQGEQAVDNHLNDSGAADPGQANDASSPTDNADPNDQLLEALATHQPPAGRREVVFVDTSLEDYQKLIGGIDPSAEVVLLDPTRDGVEQIAEVLAGRSGIDAIHIVSHGSQAELQLGTARLTLDSMTGRYVDELATIGQALTDEADLLVYGCNFGEGGQGQEAAAKLAARTGADVAASEDLSGHAKLGGDWDLEFRAGAIETTVAFSEQTQAQWEGLLATVVVDTTDDVDDGDTSSIDNLEANKGADGKISLREAILATNNTANDPGSADLISFNIAAALVGGVHTIAPTSALPDLTEAVVIDGTTESDFAGTPMIELNGTGAGFGVSGLTFDAGSGGSTVRGLVINRFSGHGISISSGSNSNIVVGNYIGTNAAGTDALGNGNYGVFINASAGNTIGDTTAGAGNVISGNSGSAIWLLNADSNTIQGNLLGTDAAGIAVLGNGLSNVVLDNSDSNLIGGTTAAARNVMSGSTWCGVYFTTGSANNLVQGNYIGTDITGAVDLGNQAAGVRIDNASTNNTIGGTAAGAGNVISGNQDAGIDILAASNNNTVAGNYIGTNAAGTAALGNSHNGVFISASTGNTIGGTAAGSGNVISGNGESAVWLSGADSNTIQGNLMGTNAAGTAVIGNGLSDVVLDNSDGNQVGGTTAAARNVISGSTWHGVLIRTNATSNLIQGNYIGTDITGTADLGNQAGGVRIENSANGNTVGGTAAGAGNVISGNDGVGVYILSNANAVAGNTIGLNAAGTAALGNSLSNIVIDSSDGNQIGGTTAAARNVISASAFGGVWITSASLNNTVQGNYIGTDITGAVAMGNAGRGIVVSVNSENNTIGGAVAGAGNVVSANGSFGIWINADNNTIAGNTVGLDAGGTADLGNGSYGVWLDGWGNVLGGTTAAARNVISGNRRRGVHHGWRQPA